LTRKEIAWKEKLGKSNLKSGNSLPLLIPSAVKIADLPESFKADILSMLNETGPMRRDIVKHFELMNCLRNLSWELYRMDCCNLADVILDHHLSPRISGKQTFH